MCYNEDMRHTKRTTKLCLVSILIILLATSIVILVINLFQAHREYAIEDILQTSFNDISYIKTGGASQQDEDYSVSKFINEYGNIKVKKFSGDTGNTAHQYYVAYNSNNQALFTIVEIGNRNLLYISKGVFNINENNSDKLYQKVDKY